MLIHLFLTRTKRIDSCTPSVQNSNLAVKIPQDGTVFTCSLAAIPPKPKEVFNRIDRRRNPTHYFVAVRDLDASDPRSCHISALMGQNLAHLSQVFGTTLGECGELTRRHEDRVIGGQEDTERRGGIVSDQSWIAGSGSTSGWSGTAQRRYWTSTSDRRFRTLLPHLRGLSSCLRVRTCLHNVLQAWKTLLER